MDNFLNDERDKEIENLITEIKKEELTAKESDIVNIIKAEESSNPDISIPDLKNAVSSGLE